MNVTTTGWRASAASVLALTALSVLGGTVHPASSSWASAPAKKVAPASSSWASTPLKKVTPARGGSVRGGSVRGGIVSPDGKKVMRAASVNPAKKVAPAKKAAVPAGLTWR